MSAKLLLGLTSAAVFAFLLASVSCQPGHQTNQPAMDVTDTEAWDSYVNGFLEDYFKAHPDFAVRQGRHEFDGKLPDWSAEGFAKEAKRLHAEKERVAAFPELTLSPRQRFERDYIASVIDADLFWIESAEWPFRCPQYYADSIDPDVYVSREYAPLEQRLKAYTAYAKAVPTAVEQIRKNLRTPLPKTFVDIGHTTFGGLISFYEKDVPAIFASVKDQQLQKDFTEANNGAIKAMKDMDDWFKSLAPTANDNFQLGGAKFSEMLKATERVDVPLDELAQIGRRNLDRNLSALKEACATFALGATVMECVAKAQSHKPTGGAVEMARKQLGDLKAFILEKKVVTIPGPEEARVNEAPAYRRWNFAYINIPGPYEKGLPSVYYIAPPDPAWSQKEKDNYVPGIGSLLFTSAHEVWPGHFLQFLHANRSSSKLGQLFVGYAFSEGWAHYTEEMMWDAGLGNNEPEMHIGQLLEALLRNVRFVSAIEMHTGKMTVAESEKMFLEEGYQDAANARQQAARGTFDPAYLNYTMGKLMIRKLREDWTATRGGKQAWQAFHDEFLNYGGPPIPLVRKAMLPGDTGSLF
jgi:hypothetical protein